MVGKDLTPNLEHLKIYGEWHEFEEMLQVIEPQLNAVGDTTKGRRLKSITLAFGLVWGNT